jgi:hypothetical protein
LEEDKSTSVREFDGQIKNVSDKFQEQRSSDLKKMKEDEE